MWSANCKTNQMTVRPLDAIGKTVHFLGAENAVLHPSHNVPPAGRTNVDGKIVFCIMRLLCGFDCYQYSGRMLPILSAKVTHSL